MLTWLAYNKFNMGSVITFIMTADRTLCKTILNIGPDTNCVSEFMALLKDKKNLWNKLKVEIQIIDFNSLLI